MHIRIFAIYYIVEVLITLCRRYNARFDELRDADSNEITQMTGCLKPCKYRKYSFLGEPYPSALKSDFYMFSLWSVSHEVNVEVEELIYPLSSLVAEFGGNLSHTF